MARGRHRPGCRPGRHRTDARRVRYASDMRYSYAGHALDVEGTLGSLWALLAHVALRLTVGMA